MRDYLAQRTAEMARMNRALSQEVEERCLAEERLKKANRALRTLSASNLALIRARDEGELLGNICRAAVEQGGYSLACVALATGDGEERTLVSRAFHSGCRPEETSFPCAEAGLEHNPLLQAFRTGKHVIVRGIPSDPAFTPWHTAALHAGFSSVLALPLPAADGALGVLAIFAGKEDSFEGREVMLLDEMAGDLGYGIVSLRAQAERKRAEEELRRLNAELEQRVIERTVQLEAANRAKSDFLANMSHELRTPLNSVIGFSEVLRDRMFGPMNEKQQEYVSHILTSGHHLLSLINDILDLSKVESGKMELELSRFKLRTLLDSSLTMLREKAMKHGIAMTLDMAPEADREIEADERKLKQVIFNLLSNAVKFTPDGGAVRVNARLVPGSWFLVPGSNQQPRTENQEPRTDFVEISVTDTGIGIRPQDMAMLFTPFQQIESPYTRQYEGTGLGLALSRRLVELHGGQIRAESTLGRGSRFTFVIPAGQETGGQAPDGLRKIHEEVQ